MARGKGKYGPKSKILVVLKSAHQKFLENALSKLIFSKVENRTPYSFTERWAAKNDWLGSRLFSN